MQNHQILELNKESSTSEYKKVSTRKTQFTFQSSIKKSQNNSKRDSPKTDMFDFQDLLQLIDFANHC